MEETEFAEMFSRFGEIQEPYIHKEKGFGFVKMVSNIVDCVVIEYLYMSLVGLKRIFRRFEGQTAFEGKKYPSNLRNSLITLTITKIYERILF